VFTAWWTYLLIVSVPVGFFLLQSALQAGRLVASQPGITLANPLVAAVWGAIATAADLKSAQHRLAGSWWRLLSGRPLRASGRRDIASRNHAASVWVAWALSAGPALRLGRPRPTVACGAGQVPPYAPDHGVSPMMGFPLAGRCCVHTDFYRSRDQSAGRPANAWVVQGAREPPLGPWSLPRADRRFEQEARTGNRPGSELRRARPSRRRRPGLPGRAPGSR